MIPPSFNLICLAQDLQELMPNWLIADASFPSLFQPSSNLQNRHRCTTVENTFTISSTNQIFLQSIFTKLSTDNREPVTEPSLEEIKNITLVTAIKTVDWTTTTTFSVDQPVPKRLELRGKATKSHNNISTQIYFDWANVGVAVDRVRHEDVTGVTPISFTTIVTCVTKTWRHSTDGEQQVTEILHVFWTTIRLTTSGQTSATATSTDCRASGSGAATICTPPTKPAPVEVIYGTSVNNFCNVETVTTIWDRPVGTSPRFRRGIRSARSAQGSWTKIIIAIVTIKIFTVTIPGHRQQTRKTWWLIDTTKVCSDTEKKNADKKYFKNCIISPYFCYILISLKKDQESTNQFGHPPLWIMSKGTRYFGICPSSPFFLPFFSLAIEFKLLNVLQ